MKVYYICKYAEASDEEKPACNMGICSDECKYTSDPDKALYKDHTEFEERGNSGDLWEVKRDSIQIGQGNESGRH